MVIRNPHKRMKALNVETREFVNASHLLTFDNIRNASLDAHILNSFNSSYSLTKYHFVLKNIVPLPPRSIWLKNIENEFVEVLTQRYSENYKEKRIRYVLERLLNALKGRRIAVELSGGLDSALVFSNLAKYGACPLAVGYAMQRYEFRTERKIQDKMLEMYDVEKNLIYDQAGFDVNFDEIPPHILPDELSLTFSRHKIIADICERNNIELVLGGYGGDALFCNSYDGRQLAYRPWEWEHYWVAEYVYASKGIQFCSGYSSRALVACLLSLRKNESSIDNEDTFKEWARNKFQRYIPSELAKYNYKGSFDAFYFEGLCNQIESIKNVLKLARSVVPDSRLSIDFVGKRIQRYAELNSKENIELFAIISFAAWINSAIRKIHDEK